MLWSMFDLKERLGTGIASSPDLHIQYLYSIAKAEQTRVRKAAAVELTITATVYF
jgi:hypothetical protein